MSLKEKLGNWQVDRIYIIMKIKLIPWVHLSLPGDYMYVHVYDHNSQTSLFVYTPGANCLFVYTPGANCSKLTTSLVNDSLKF